MYRSTQSVCYSEATDFMVALFLERPSNVAVNGGRSFVNQSVSNNSSVSISMLSTKVIRTLGMVFHTYPSGTPSGSVRMRVSSLNHGVVIDKTVPYTPAFGFSLTEASWAAIVGANDTDSFIVSVYNNTGVSINVCYVTMGPLMAYNSLSGLLSVDVGESMGDDEYLPDFGVSHMYGSFSVKDVRGATLSVLRDSYSYNLDTDLARYPLRCEVIVGTQLVGVLAVDEFSFGDGGKRFSATLRSVLLDLDGVPGFGQRVADLSQVRTLSDALVEFFANVKGSYPTVLSQFDFGGISGSDALDGCTIDGPLALLEGTTLLGFLGKLCEALGLTIGIRHVLTTGMQYQFSVYGAYLSPTPEQNISQLASKSLIGPTDVIGEVEYTPLVRNHVDKITYSRYAVSVSEAESTHSIEYQLSDVADYVGGTAGLDRQAFKEHWEGKSPSAGLPVNNPLETTYGMRIPRPSDVSYDQASSRYVAPVAELEKSESRALTRGFLWRFRFPTSFPGNPFAKAEVGGILSAMSDMSVYGGGGTRDVRYQVWPRGSTYDRAGMASSFEYYGMIMTAGSTKTVRFNGATPSKMFWVDALFSDFKSHYTLHYRLPPGVYMVSGEAYELRKSFSYWYLPQFGFNPWDVEDPTGHNAYDAYTTRYFGTSFYKRTVDGAVVETITLGVDKGNSAYHGWSDGMGAISDYMTLRSSALQITVYVTFDMAITNTYMTVANASGVYNTYDNMDPYEDNGRFYVGMCNDMDGGYGAPDVPFNVDDQTHSGEQVIWPSQNSLGTQSPDGKPWYHSGFQGDADARGDASKVYVSTTLAAASVAAKTCRYGSDGSLFVEEALPSSDYLRVMIRQGEDNFLDGAWKVGDVKSGWDGDEDAENPGQNFAESCNAYCTLWSVNGYWCLQNNHESIYRAEDPDSLVRWCNPRPSYGFCVRSVEYSITGRFLSVSEGGKVTVQFNAQNQYNYDLATNELMTDNLRVGDATCTDFLLGSISADHANGKPVYWVKCKVRGIPRASTTSVAPFVRHFYLGDPISSLSTMKGGQASNLLPQGGGNQTVRAVEYVMEGGSCHVNLRIM